MIPYGRQSIDEEDIEAVVKSLKSDWLTQGPALEKFESDLARQCNADFAVACNSGTAALHMAYSAAGIGPGNVVVVPANTFLATANAAIYLGAEVRFCDVDPDTGSMTTETLEAVLDDRVRAVVPVHFAGQACEMEAIERLVRDRCPRATIIEDACHAIGGTYRDGTPIGSPRYASMVVFSFHPVKHIAAGEGGAVTTSSRQLKEQLEQFRCHGMTKDPEELRRPDEGPWYYEMHSPGFNYRIPEAACALASSQLAKLHQSVARRRKIVAKYQDELGGIDHLSLPPRSHLKTSAWHLFCLHIDYPALEHHRADVMAGLKDRGVGTQVHYYPVSLQPYYQDRYRHTETQFPGAVSHYRRELSIPLFPSMTAAEVDQVVSSIRHVLTSKSNAKRQVA